ncbi:hypothetical protein B5C34_01935 [Pacificimonas flava]|uniref:Uncharacterized protein n=2 Tax=Pacificimonas TaxID=1960290 RepID=A0A219B2B7_9SPHN|nr:MULTISPECIES: hypothetical protein [Pacificimonas]MBZ6378021.1 hypothetical protein [Pacificimonas aurantium]OWV32334.1 hypothetical protein B5C34_01935 [Pacificimonas flava]
MTDQDRHDAKNLEAQNHILKKQLSKTADQLDELAESDCDPDEKKKSERTAKRSRKMADS